MWEERRNRLLTPAAKKSDASDCKVLPSRDRKGEGWKRTAFRVIRTFRREARVDTRASLRFRPSACHFSRKTAESPIATLKLGHGRVQFGLAEIRPQRGSEVHLGVSALPQKEV